jgi:hypothetical protein
MRRRYSTERMCIGCCVVLVLLVTSHVALAEPVSKHHRAAISPSLVYLQPGEEQQFKTVIVATRLMAAQTPEEVNWAVNDIPGGNTTVGTVDETGLYRAPSTVPSPREIHICAEVPEAANRYLWATVIIGDSPAQYKQLDIWSEPVEEGKHRTAHLTDPHGIGLDKDGNILIADQLGNAVHRYTADGKYLGQIGLGHGSKPGEFTEPRIVVPDAVGNIFVSDSKGDRPRVQVFSPAGEFLRIFAEKGMQPGMLLRCHGMDFDPQQRLYTVDVDNMRVNVYENSGEFLYDWGTEGLNPGEFNSPHGIFVDRNCDVFVTGYYGPTQKFNSEGDFLVAFCHGDPPDGPVYFHNMTGDRWGDVYVMVRASGGYQGAFQTGDVKRVSIMKYNNNGDFITGWSFSSPDHRETTAVVDDEGRVYALFVGPREMGVEIFVEE